MKRGTPRHPKMYALAHALTVPLYSAVGILELLWHHAAQVTPQGDIGSLPDKAIADCVDWKRKPGLLIDALVSARWLERDHTYRLIIHDWPEHCEQSVVKLLDYRKHDFLPLYGKSIADRMKKKSRESLENGYPLDRESLPSREAKARGGGFVEGRGPGRGAKNGVSDPDLLDEHWRDFRKRYESTGKPLIDEDFAAALPFWRKMSTGEKLTALEGIRLRIEAGQWADPNYIPKPERYLRTEYKRRVIQKSRPHSKSEESTLGALALFKRGKGAGA